MSAREELDRALEDMTANGERVRCSWPDLAPLYVSEDETDRARAARRCHGCPVLELCGASADEERDAWTVRAGIDRRPLPKARRVKRKSA